MCKLTHERVNPLIGSAGVSAVPMAARVSQKVGARLIPQTSLLMYAMAQTLQVLSVQPLPPEHLWPSSVFVNH